MVEPDLPATMLRAVEFDTSDEDECTVVEFVLIPESDEDYW